jgi:hypothetical protein
VEIERTALHLPLTPHVDDQHRRRTQDREEDQVLHALRAVRDVMGWKASSFSAPVAATSRP